MRKNGPGRGDAGHLRRRGKNLRPVSERAQLKNLHPEGHRRLNLPVGVPLLQFYGMTVERRGGPVRGAAVYPDMLRWLR
jgi:hypothetical protein